jgi:hypothetical protein
VIVAKELVFFVEDVSEIYRLSTLVTAFRLIMRACIQDAVAAGAKESLVAGFTKPELEVFLMRDDRRFSHRVDGVIHCF